MNRFLKQFLFLGMLVLIIGVAVFLVYRETFFPAASCLDGIQNQNEEGVDCGSVCGISCEQKYPKELSYSNVKFFKVGDLVSVVFDLDNLNQSLGLKTFKYKIDFYGFADKLLGSTEGTSFIYPNQSKESADWDNKSKKIVDAGKKIIGEVTSVRISFSSLDWKSASEFRSIKLDNINAKTTKDGDFYAVSGTLKNLYSFVIPQTTIDALLMDKSGNILGASKTDITNLLPFEDRDYRVLIQIDKSQESNVNFSGTRLFIYPVNL